MPNELKDTGEQPPWQDQGGVGLACSKTLSNETDSDVMGHAAINEDVGLNFPACNAVRCALLAICCYHLCCNESVAVHSCTSKVSRESPLVVPGDAIASFITDPDEVTRGRCTMDRYFSYPQPRTDHKNPQPQQWSWIS